MKIRDVISEVNVYNLENAIKGSKYPMAVDLSKLTDETTKTVKALASSKQGEGHDQFLTGIIVSFDLTLSNKAWVETERYNFLNFISSQSTMHRIAKFDLNNQYVEYVDSRMIDIMNELKDKYNETQDKVDYLKLLYSNPCGFKLTAKMVTNYRQLKTIYKQRRQHRLPEWQVFCDWIETLPRFKELVGIE